MMKYSKVTKLLEIYITVNPAGCPFHKESLFPCSRLLHMGKQVHLTC